MGAVEILLLIKPKVELSTLLVETLTPKLILEILICFKDIIQSQIMLWEPWVTTKATTPSQIMLWEPWVTTRDTILSQIMLWEPWEISKDTTLSQTVFKELWETSVAMLSLIWLSET